MVLDDTKLKILCEGYTEAFHQRIEQAKGKKENSPEERTARYLFSMLLGMDIVLSTGGYTIDYVTGEIRKVD